MGDAEKSKEALLAELRSLRQQVAELEAEHRIQIGGVAPNTTPRKQAEEALQESHDLLRAIIEGTPDMIFAKHVDGRHTLMNTSAARATGRPVEDVIGKSNADLFPPEVARSFDLEDAEVLSSGKTRIYENTMRIGGSLRTVLTTKYVYKDREGKALGVIGIARDITERKRAEQQLADQSEQLRKLTSELVLAEEQTRREIGRDLHDHIGQILALAQGKLGTLRASEASEALGQPLEEIHALLEQTIRATRSLTFELSSPVLYELGLEAALESLSEQMEQQHSPRFHFETDAQPKPLAENTSVALYRITRELLFNVVRHAQARNVQMTLRRVGDHLHLTIEDDGGGFDAAGLGKGFSQSGGFGLFSIRQQLDHIGGRFEIEAIPGDGTRALVVAPLA